MELFKYLEVNHTTSQKINVQTSFWDNFLSSTKELCVQVNIERIYSENSAIDIVCITSFCALTCSVKR